MVALKKKKNMPVSVVSVALLLLLVVITLWGAYLGFTNYHHLPEGYLNYSLTGDYFVAEVPTKENPEHCNYTIYDAATNTPIQNGSGPVVLCWQYTWVQMNGVEILLAHMVRENDFDILIAHFTGFTYESFGETIEQPFGGSPYMTWYDLLYTACPTLPMGNPEVHMYFRPSQLACSQ
jgi:hypothetical protein